jgi:hypothetical protein
LKTKKDDSRRRAAHTAAEQKRRNAIRVNKILFFFKSSFKYISSRKDMIPYKILYLIVNYLIRLVHKKLAKQLYLNAVSNLQTKNIYQFLYLLATDYLAQLNKEKQQLSNQLESKKKETFCLRAVQKFVQNFGLKKQTFVINLNRAYEDILEINMNSNKNANASIDDEQKFQVVCSKQRKTKTRLFVFQFQSISDAIFLTFDQAMQTGQVTNFTQFTSIILRWIEDACRPAVNKSNGRDFE